MSTLSERLKKAMQESPDINGAAIARACNIAPASVSDWLSGKTKAIKEDNLRNTAKLLGVRQTWLSTGRGHMRGVENEDPPAIYEQRLSARGLRILARLVAAEEQGTVNSHIYQIIEQALILADKQADSIPATEPHDALASLSASQRDALTAFIQSLTRG